MSEIAGQALMVHAGCRTFPNTVLTMDCRGQTMISKRSFTKRKRGAIGPKYPAIPGCATQGETLEELLKNLHDAIEGCLSVDVEPPDLKDDKTRIVEIAV